MGKRGSLILKRRLLKFWGDLPLPRRLRWWMIYSRVRKFPIGAAAVILDDEGRILLFRHTYRGRYPWGLPSGWLETGEDPGDAIAREIHEESGLRVKDVQIMLSRSARDVRRIDLLFRCRIAGGTFRPSAEVSEMAWFERQRLPAMLDDQYDMILEILDRLGEN